MPPDPRNTPRPRSLPARRVRAACGAVLACLAAVAGAGCQTTSLTPFSIWKMGTDSSLSQGPTAKELGPDDRNFFARMMWPKALPRPSGIR